MPAAAALAAEARKMAKMRILDGYTSFPMEVGFRGSFDAETRSRREDFAWRTGGQEAVGRLGYRGFAYLTERNQFRGSGCGMFGLRGAGSPEGGFFGRGLGVSGWAGGTRARGFWRNE